MRLLLYDMGAYTQNDIMYSLNKLGIQFRNILYKLKDIREDSYFEKKVQELLAREHYDGILSVNYFPILAELCNRNHIPYISWTYDSPIDFLEKEKTFDYPTNYSFFFDRAEYEKYRKIGHQNVFHLPLAVNCNRIDQIKINNTDINKYICDVSMVGQLYESYIEGLILPIAEYDQGFLSALLETQFYLYGGFILEDSITDELVTRMNRAYKKLGQTAIQLDKSGLINAMSKHITHMERTLILDALSNEHSVKLYGPDECKDLVNVKWMGSAGYFDEMPKIFQTSKINLNITLKSIKTGIPLRVLDIMGSKGFVISNWQEELAEYFTDGEDVVMYTSPDEAIDKVAFYLKHENLRKEIVKKSYQKIKKYFCYEDRLKYMFDNVEFN